jgi:hypothetical protein
MVTVVAMLLTYKGDKEYGKQQTWREMQNLILIMK